MWYKYADTKIITKEKVKKRRDDKILQGALMTGRDPDDFYALFSA